MLLIISIISVCVLASWNQETFIKKNKRRSTIKDIILFKAPKKNREAYFILVMIAALSFLFFFHIHSTNIGEYLSKTSIKDYSIITTAISMTLIFIARSNMYANQIKGDEFDENYLLELWKIDKKTKECSAEADRILEKISVSLIATTILLLFSDNF